MGLFSPTLEANPAMEPGSLNRRFGDTINTALVKQRESLPPRDYLGASRWGHYCERALGYEFTHTPKDPGAGFSGETYRIFDRGHDGEDRVAEYMRYAGFTLKTQKANGEQFGFWVADGKAGGHVDGVILSGPLDDLQYPLLWENKVLGDKGFKDVVKHGVKASKPVYYVQTMVYCAYLDLPNGCLFTAMNGNNGELYAEHVPFDAQTAQENSDKAVRVISAGSPEELPRCTSDESNYLCRFCDYRVRCWQNKTTQPRTEIYPGWL